ncbi:ATP-binding protein, partial [Carboxydocella sp. ULO1]|uniref:ATP-binding protein n=1 Tax=Carboxydocella sp. ULO1 TaxID=1926599 RepID=UPI0009ABCE22
KQKKINITVPKISISKPFGLEIKKVIDSISNNFPKTEIGFYSLENQIIINNSLPGEISLIETFTPNQQNIFINVIRSRNKIIRVNNQNGSIEGYSPVYVNGKIIGVVWVRENLQPSIQNLENSRNKIYKIIILGFLVGISGSVFLINNFEKEVKKIKYGLSQLKQNLNTFIPVSVGPIGEIAKAINSLSEELRRVYGYNKIILNSIDEGILALDFDKKIILINRAFINILQINPVIEMNNKKYTEIIIEDEIKQVIDETYKYEQGIKDKKITLTNRAKQQIDLLIGTAILKDFNEKFLGIALTIRDITEREKMLSIIRRSERLTSLGTLVAGVAHEIRNPLTAIHGYIQFWLKKGNQIPSQKALKTITREIERLNNLVEKLLFFAKPQQINLIEQNVNHIIKKVLAFVQEIIPTSIKIKIDLQQNLPLIRCDESQLEIVFNNIIYNAIQAMPDGGTLHITTWFDEKQQAIKISFKDTGVGIPTQLYSRLFDPFFTTKPKGMGLGLAIAYEIVKNHGGEIEVHSMENKGSEFVVILSLNHPVPQECWE